MMPPRSSRSRFKSYTIRARLLIAFVSTVVFLGLAIGSASTVIAWNNGQQQVINKLESVATLKEAEINTWAETLQTDLHIELHREPAKQRLRLLLQTSSDSPHFQEAYRVQRQRFQDTLMLRPAFEELFLLDRQGKIVIASPADAEGEYRREQAYFRKGLEQPGIHLQTFSISGVSANWNTIIAVHPVMDEQGRPLGVLAGRASLATLNQIMRERTGLGETGETYLVNSNNILLTDARLPEYNPGQFFVHTKGVQDAIRETRNGHGLYESYHKAKVIGVYRWLPQLEVVLLAEQRQDEAFAPIYTTIKLNLGITLVAVLLVIVLSMFITGSIATPISDLARTATHIASGDLSKIADIHRRDEIGDLAVAFNSMTAQLTEKIHAEQEQTRQVQQIIDTVPEGVILLDASRTVIRANPLGRKDLQALASTEVGQPLLELDGHPLEDFLTSPPKGLWHELTKDEQYYQVLARPFENGPESEGWVLVIRNVTQQHEFQEHVQQQERLAAIGQLAAGIAHDFNNIMTTIVLYAQMMARSPELGAQGRKRVTTINQQAQQAAQLIQQILDFSRRAVLERRPLSLLTLLKEQVTLLQRTLPENVIITLDAQLQSEEAFVVNADPTRIQQMVMNLALNARDAMPQGGDLRLGLERIQTDASHPDLPSGDWIKLAVTDTGAGIPAHVLPHIFEPFFTTKEPGQGSGLGLAQVHGIVGAHEGHIDVNTKVGQGTTFIIHLPVLRSKTRAGLYRQNHSQLPLGQGQTVLVVEDAAAVRTALVESLNKLNYDAREATNGQKALQLLEAAPDEVDLILCDVVMPEMGGIALFHTVQAQYSHIPVILISGHPLEHEIDRLEGLNGWLTKPPDLEKLAEMLYHVLQNPVGPFPPPPEEDKDGYRW